jgi:hypothetical protein
MKRILIIAAVLLAGCQNTPQAKPDDNVLPLDPTVAQKCAIVPAAPPRDTADMGQLLEFGDLMVGLYGECATRDAGKYDWIKSQGH